MNTENLSVGIRPPILYLAALAIGILVHRFIPLRLFGKAGTGHLVGWPVFILGAVIVLWAEKTLKKHGVEPSFKPVPQIVSSGPYAFSRNPMYLATSLLYLGLSLALNSIWPILFLPPTLLILHFAVITREELYLEKVFGQEYQQYRSKVRRWF